MSDLLHTSINTSLSLLENTDGTFGGELLKPVCLNYVLKEFSLVNSVFLRGYENQWLEFSVGIVNERLCRLCRQAQCYSFQCG